MLLFAYGMIRQRQLTAMDPARVQSQRNVNAISNPCTTPVHVLSVATTTGANRDEIGMSEASIASNLAHEKAGLPGLSPCVR